MHWIGKNIHILGLTYYFLWCRGFKKKINYLYLCSKNSFRSLEILALKKYSFLQQGKKIYFCKKYQWHESCTHLWSIVLYVLLHWEVLKIELSRAICQWIRSWLSFVPPWKRSIIICHTLKRVIVVCHVDPFWPHMALIFQM
jgi:hypothetical protein